VLSQKASGQFSRAIIAAMRCARDPVVAPAALAAVAALVLGLSGGASATPPPEVQQALRAAGVPDEALAFVVQEASSGRTLADWQGAVTMNPASLAKLVTTQAALERLGPAWTWSTPVWVQGAISADGVLDGNVHVRGQGDPKLVQERLWLLLRRVAQLGIREIRGDIVLDSSAFVVPDGPAGEFDGEASRPYNVKPQALLLNYRAVIYTFTPDAGAGVARIGVEPPLARHEVDRTVPLVNGPCNDWRGSLDMRSAAATGGVERIRFAGRYPLACGEQQWAFADAQPATYDARLLEGLWREMGGTLSGRVREGAAPLHLKPTFEHRSPPLAEVVRDINKFSNNVMAEQLALTLAREAAPAAPAAVTTPDAARALLQRWLVERVGAPLAAGAVVGNGSGLSRDTRIAPRQLARLLVLAHASPIAPELMASLPISAVDGTARRLRGATGRAHLKTGSLRDVYGLAGYLLAADGRRLVVAAIINHPQANAARAALDALVQWAHDDVGTAGRGPGPRHRQGSGGGGSR
jgi:serine-type D-Ala-D-Ala carboxypeptidase/endopeptidase (penicillin-binding protein 4)